MTDLQKNRVNQLINNNSNHAGCILHQVYEYRNNVNVVKVLRSNGKKTWITDTVYANGNFEYNSWSRDYIGIYS